MEKELCEVTVVNEEVVQSIKESLPSMENILPIFKALADETRLKIAYALTLHDELCVCDIAAIIDSSNATASHHLRYLKQIGLAKSTRNGKMMMYSLKDAHVLDIIQLAYEHSKEVE